MHSSFQNFFLVKQWIPDKRIVRLICILDLLSALRWWWYRKGKHLSAAITSVRPHVGTFVTRCTVQQSIAGLGFLCSDRWLGDCVMCSATCPFPQPPATHTHSHSSHPPGSSTLLLRSGQEIVNINISAIFLIIPHFSSSALDNLRAGTDDVFKCVLAKKTLIWLQLWYCIIWQWFESEPETGMSLLAYVANEFSDDRETMMLCQ